MAVNVPNRLVRCSALIMRYAGILDEQGNRLNKRDYADRLAAPQSFISMDARAVLTGAVVQDPPAVAHP